MKVSPSASQDLFDKHPNGISNIWIEKGSVNNIETLVKSWIISVYPQLSDHINEIENSPAYISMIDRFKERNRLGQGLDIFSIPRPYETKAEIVAEIVNDFLKQKQ